MGLKVGDFGLAAQVFYQGEKKRTVCGTPNYLAPEVLDQKTGHTHSYECDIWAIGVILYTMLNGRPPFESQEVKQTYKKIQAGAFAFPEHLNFGCQAKDFIRRCLTVDVNKRITLDEMLDHDFLSLVPIPKQIPVSTLVCPPAQAFAKQYALPAKSAITMAQAHGANMSPSPMGTTHIRQNRVLHHMQTAPMENALRQIKSGKSIEGQVNQANPNVKANLYSPLVVNGQENSAYDNAQFIGSEKTAGMTTPMQPGALARQVSNGPAIISEFNPIMSEDLREKALNEPQVQKNQEKVMVDNFLKTQNVLDKVKLQGSEMKSLPSSPIADARNKLQMRQMQMMSTPGHQQQPQPLSNKNRRLTSSASSTNIPPPMSRIPAAMSTAQVCYNTVNT